MSYNFIDDYLYDPNLYKRIIKPNIDNLRLESDRQEMMSRMRDFIDYNDDNELISIDSVYNCDHIDEEITISKCASYLYEEITKSKCARYVYPVADYLSKSMLKRKRKNLKSIK